MNRLYKIFLCLFSIIFTTIAAQAQTTITTTFTNNNGFAAITFNFTNNNAFPVTITEIGSVLGSTGTIATEAWYKSTAVNTTTQPTINAANGWTLIATGSVTGIANTTTTTAQPLLTGLSFSVPAGTTYGICVGVASSATLRYSSLTAGTYTQSGGGCDLVTGTNYGWAGSAVPGPLANNNRGFIGYVTFTSASATAPTCISTPLTPANNASTVCSGSTLLQWNKKSGATAYDVYLNTGTAAPTTIASANLTDTFLTVPTTAGPYTWSVIPKNSVGSATGCSFWNFTVIANPAPSVSIAASPSGTICAGTPVTFTATPVNGGSAPTYQWKKNSANVGTNSTTYTDNTLTSTDVISVVMTSNATCASPGSATSNTITKTVVPRPTASFTPAGVSTICAGGSVTLSANTGTGFTYQWQQGGGTNISGATGATYNATAGGNYRVVVSNGTCADTSVYDTVNAVARPVATVTTTGTTTICAGGTVDLTGPAPSTGMSYQWQLNGANITGATGDTYTASAAGNYRLVYSNGICADTSTAVTVTVNPQPTATATAGGPLAFCTGGSVTLTANTGTGITYKWMRNNVTIAGATAATYTASATGAYTVVVTNTGTGCSDTSDPAITVTVSTIPSNVLTPNGSLTFCQGGSVRLQAATGTGFTYVWVKDAAVITGATASSYTATAAGVYYCVITNGPCVTTTGTRTVVVNALPTATATAAGPTAFCTGGAVVLNANTGTGLTYQWRLNATAITGATSSSYTATASGVYSVVVSNGTCTNTSSSVVVNVSAMPAPAITAGGPASFCQGNSVTLSTPANIGYTYQWLLNSVPVSGATANAFSATASGNYTVTVVNGTCTATSAPFTVTVIPAPPATVSPAGPTSFCQGGSVVLNANRGSGYTYQWTRNAINITGATSWQYTATTTGTYAVKLSDGTCPATSGNTSVVVNDFPNVTVSVSGGVNLTTTGTYVSYQWYFNGVIIPGATSQTYTATRDGYYSVVVTDAAGCTATSPVKRITALDVNNVNGNKTVKIWPNPVTAEVHVDADAAVDISIGSIDGRELLQASNARSVDLSSLPQGLYLIRVSDHQSGALIRTDKINKR